MIQEVENAAFCYPAVHRRDSAHGLRTVPRSWRLTAASKFDSLPQSNHILPTWWIVPFSQVGNNDDSIDVSNGSIE